MVIDIRSDFVIGLGLGFISLGVGLGSRSSWIRNFKTWIRLRLIRDRSNEVGGQAPGTVKLVVEKTRSGGPGGAVPAARGG